MQSNRERTRRRPTHEPRHHTVPMATQEITTIYLYKVTVLTRHGDCSTRLDEDLGLVWRECKYLGMYEVTDIYCFIR